MNFRPLLILVFVCSFFSLKSQAQTISQQKLTNLSVQIDYNPESKIPSYIKLKSENQFSFENLKTWLKTYFAFDDQFDLKLLTAESDQLGYTHYRYQQLYKGIPVEQTMYIIHVHNNKVVSMNGLLYDHFQVDVNKPMNKEKALKAALNFVNAKTYMWQNAENEKLIKAETGDPSASWFPKGELAFIAQDNVLNAKLNKLTYKFDIYATEPLSRQYIYVDVLTNRVIVHLDRIHTSDTLVTAKTAMSGDQRIYVDYVAANSFRLREAKRGNGIETYNLQKGTNYGNAIDFTDTDTTWNNVNANYDEYATDAHFGSQMTYDFYKKSFNRNSIDNNGFKLKSYIHYSSNYVNAFWNGSYMTYGDGNGSTVYPLVSLDIAGHEITHGLTTKTANLTYSYESGALNESYSDIFGTAIEWYGDSSRFEWELGTKIGLTIRSMANPKDKGDPDTYKGINWYVGTADNGGVHTNSGVQNFWFYLLCNGDTGTNDNGDFYSVDSIGMVKASAVAYRTLTYYLTSSSQYIDARKYSIIAAEDLYGTCSDEMFAVAAAWHAVGVGYKLDVVAQAVLQQNTNNINPSTTDNVILRIDVLPACSDTDTVTVFSFNTLGTTIPSNIKRAKLWYTGASATFSAVSQFGSTKNNPSGVFTFSGSRALLKNSDNYFWLTYDVDTAKVGEVFDAVCSYVVTDTTVIPVDSNPSGSRVVSPCIPSMTNGCYSGGMCISNVSLNNLSNNTGNSCNTQAYTFYSSKKAQLEQGTTYFGSVSVTTYSAYLSLWIDFNDDGVFNDSNERMVNAQYINGNSTGNISVAIPSNAKLGDHVMRIRHQYSGSYISLTACSNGYYGEIEDYYATIVKPTDMSYLSSSTIQVTGNLSKGSVDKGILGLKINTLGSYNPLKLYGISYTTDGSTDTLDISNAKLYYTGNSSIFAATTQIGSSIANPGKLIHFNDSFELSSGANYFWLAYDIASSATLGNVVDATIDSFVFGLNTYIPDTTSPAGNREISFCIPPVSTSPCTYMYISNVSLDSINNTSTCSSTSYSDFTSKSTTISQGNSASFSVTSYVYNQYVNIWVDYNNNGVFDTIEYVVKNLYTSNNLKATGSFTVPVTTPIGKHRMRITADYYQLTDTSGCGGVYYGETEDYTLIVDSAKYIKVDSVFTTQNKNTVQKNTTYNQIIGFNVRTKQGYYPSKLAKIYMSSNGTTDTNDIYNAKLWYTNSSNVFATGTQVGATVSAVGQNYSFSDSINLLLGNNYFWLTYDVASTAKFADLIDATLDSIEVTSQIYYPDSASPVGSRLIDYCIPPASNSPCVYMHTTNVTIDSINNSTGCNNKSYSDFTNLSTTAKIGELVNYQFSVYQYNQYFNVWVDFDQDGIFDSTELVVKNKATAAYTTSGSFMIPASAKIGKTRVRVMADYNSLIGRTPCSQLDYGETEDYSIYIDSAKDMSIKNIQVKQVRAAVQPSTYYNEVLRVKISTTGVKKPFSVRDFVYNVKGSSDTNDINKAQVWYTANDSNFYLATQFGADVTQIDTSNFTVSDSMILQAGDNYFWISFDIDSNATIKNVVDAECISINISGTQYSPDSTAPYGNRIIDYCTPIGGQANSYNNTYEFGITKVSLNSISNTTGVPNTMTDYYKDYTATITYLVLGSSYTLAISPGSSAGNYTQSTIAWIDWNQNYIFDTAELVGKNMSHTGICSLTVNVPGNLNNGKYRLRIMSGYGYYYNYGGAEFTPCLSQKVYKFDIGECEDYTVQVVGTLAKPTISPSSASTICIGSSKTYTTAYDSNYTYTWFTTAGNILLSGKGHPYDTLTYTPAQAGTESIKVTITNNYNQVDTSNSVTLTVSDSNIAGTISASQIDICFGDSVLLTSSAISGNAQWQYLSSGNWVNTGNSTNPLNVIPTDTITYRIFGAKNACPSDSSNLLTINISPKPKAGSITPTSKTICLGDSIKLLLAGSKGNVSWGYYNGNTWQNLGQGGGSSLVQYPNVSTIYRTIATSGVCKTDSSNKATITVDSIAVAGSATVSSNNICIGDSVLLTLSNSKGTIKWQKLVNGVWTQMSGSSSNYKVAPTAYTTYRAWVTSGSCFVDSSNEVSIDVAPKSVSGNLSANLKNICEGDSVKLSLTGYTGRISWESNNGSGWQVLADTLDQLTVAPSVTITYRAVLSSGACSKDTTNAYQINVTPKAVAGTLSVSANSICIGDSVYISISGYTGFISWQENNGAGWQFFGNNQNSQYVKPTKNYQYRVILTSGLCGKDTSSVVSVNVTPNANAGVVSSQLNAVCPGGLVELINIGAIGSKDWEQNDGSQWISKGTAKDTIQVTASTKTSYRVISTTACGVHISNVYVVDVYKNPTAVIAPGGPLDYCNGDSAILQSSKAVQYSWSNGSTSQSTVIKSTTSIYVVVTDSNGCKDTSNTNVYTFHSPAAPSLTRQGDSLIATPVGASLYIWKIGNNTVATSSTNILIPKSKGIYTVEYKDQYGCLSSASNTLDFSFVGVQSITSAGEVKVWPNPSTGLFNLNISGLRSSQALLKLTDLAGKSVLQKNQVLGSGEVFINIDLKEYAKGIYILYLEDESGMLIAPVKLIKE